MNRYSNKFFVRRDDIFTRVSFFDEVRTEDGKAQVDVPDTVILFNSDADRLAELIVKIREQHDAKKGTKQ